MKTFAIATLAATAATASAAFTPCNVINAAASGLPTTCTCTNSATGFTVACVQAIKFVVGVAPLAKTIVDTTMTAGFGIDLCGAHAGAAMSIGNTDPAVTFSKHIEAGSTEKIPIPDFSYDIPDIATVGMFANVAISGTADALTMDVSITDCYTPSGGKQKCGDPSMGLFPLEILKGTYKFVDHPTCPPSAAGMGTGEIAGIAVGALAVVGAGGAILMKRRRV
jgi:hypothetical protein